MQIGRTYRHVTGGETKYLVLSMTPAGNALVSSIYGGRRGEYIVLEKNFGDYTKVKTRVVIERFARVWPSGYVEIQDVEFKPVTWPQPVADNIPIKIEYEI